MHCEYLQVIRCAIGHPLARFPNNGFRNFTETVVRSSAQVKTVTSVKKGALLLSESRTLIRNCDEVEPGMSISQPGLYKCKKGLVTDE